MTAPRRCSVRSMIALCASSLLFLAACSSGSELTGTEFEPLPSTAPAIESPTTGSADSGTSDQAPTPEQTTETSEATDTTETTETTDTTESAETPEPDITPLSTDPIPSEALLVIANRNVFNFDPNPEQLTCMTDYANERHTQDGEDYTTLVNYGGELDDTSLRQLSYMVNTCIDADSLGNWATVASGTTGQALIDGPMCFGDRFTNPDNGNAVFHTFAALTFQFRVDPTATDAVIDTLVECAPVNALSDFFAEQAEAASGFTLAVDRDCLREAVNNDEASRTFWTTLVDGSGIPADSLTSYVDSCSAETETAPEEGLDAIPEGFVPWSSERTLAGVKASARANAYDAPPPMQIDPAASYEAVFVTGGGTIRIKLFPDIAPVTVNNFVSLVRDGYYDGTVFHRVIADFMAQGGDPTGTGTGGPGYRFEDEVDNTPNMDRPGLLAMANSGPGTNGSQFFITTAATDWLTGNHTVFGEVLEGQELVNAIELREPSAPTGPGQLLESVEIIEG